MLGQGSDHPLTQVVSFLSMFFLPFLPLPVRQLIWRVCSAICPPVFYVLAAKREKLKQFRICYFLAPAQDQGGLARINQDQPGSKGVNQGQPGSTRINQDQPGPTRIIQDQPGSNRINQDQPGSGSSARYGGLELEADPNPLEHKTRVLPHRSTVPPTQSSQPKPNASRLYKGRSS